MLFVCDIGWTHNDVHKSINYGGTALKKASEMGHWECVKELLEKGALVDIQNKVSGV